MITPSGHAMNCGWHLDQYPWECTCGLSRSQPGSDGERAAAGEAVPSGGDEPDTALFPGVPEPLRGDLCFITAALSTYNGGPAADDVRAAWGRITDKLEVEP